MKKFTAVSLTLFLFVTSVFAEVGLSLYNELGSSTVNISQKDGAKFTSVYNETDFNLTSQYFDGGVDATVVLVPEDKIFFVDFADWYARFKPTDFLNIGVSDNLWADNARFLIPWIRVSYAKEGGEGFSVSGIVNNLKLTANLEFSEDLSKVPLSVAASYRLQDKAQIIARFEHKQNEDFSSSFFVSSKWINGGYAYKGEAVGITGDHIVSLSSYPKIKNLGLGVEFVTNFDKDIYFGTRVDYAIGSWLPRLQVYGWYNQDVKSTFIELGVSKFIETNHELNIKVRANVNNFDNFNVEVPVYYAYFF